MQGSINMHFTITPKSSSIFKITTGEKQLSYNNGTPVYLELKEVSDGDKVLQKEEIIHIHMSTQIRKEQLV